MKKLALFFLLIFGFNFNFGQSMPEAYFSFVKKAESLYDTKDFKNSAQNYSAAFKSNNWKASATDRYNAACSWALAAVSDSAFFQLERIANKADYSNLEHISTDTDLNSLHNDKRWSSLINKIKQNKEKAEANLNKPLIAKLDGIYTEDQKYRQQIDEIEKKYGPKSKEIDNHWRIILEKDSINLIQIKSILDKYGWLGSDVIGQRGNSTLFLVIQHADIATQEKYLPMMREAVKNGKAEGSSLALLEDRVALRQGKRQIYGSQIARDPETQTYYVLALEDPENVDKRRAAVGLEPLSDYVNNWQIKWDVKQYIKDLPQLEAKKKN